MPDMKGRRSLLQINPGTLNNSPTLVAEQVLLQICLNLKIVHLHHVLERLLSNFF